MRMKKCLKATAILVGLFFFAGLYSAEAVAGKKEKYKERFEKTAGLAKDGEVYLRNLSGDIEVTSWERDEVKIDALKISKASSLDKAKENAGKVQITVEKEGERLRVTTDYPRTRGIGKSLDVSVDFKLFIPEKASIKIKSTSGDVNIQNVGGAVDVNVVSGDLKIMKAYKGVDCEVVSGDVKLMDIEGHAYLKSVSGDVEINRIKGSIDIDSVSGDVQLIEVAGAKEIKGKALSGDFTYDGDIMPDGRYSFTAHSGDIDMILPAGSGFEVDAETFSGEIESEFEMTVALKKKKKAIQAVVNNGGAVLKLKTFSGDISLRKK